MPLTGHTYVNRAGGSRLNHQQPYRTVIRIGGDESSALPPACFFTVAIQQLRADATERVLILADSGSAWNLAGSVVAALQAAAPPPPSSPPPSNKQKAISSAADIVHANVNSPTPWWNSSVAEVIKYDRQADHDLMHITSAFRLASRAVWGDTQSRLPHPLPRQRRKKYEVVWNWCRGRRGDNEDCASLPRDSTDFEVQLVRTRSSIPGDSARAAGDSLADSGNEGSDAAGRSCKRQLAVSSTWTGSRWYDLASVHSAAAERERKRNQLTRGEWLHENTCIAYSRANPFRGSERWNILAQAHATSKQLLWPLPWKDLYAEYVPGWLRLDSETADHYLTNMVNMSDSPLFHEGGCTWHNASTVAFLTTLTMDNLYHALIHAVPTRELVMRVREGLHSKQALAYVPHYTQYWPKSFVRSVGWQMLARSLGVSASEWMAVAARAQELTMPGSCHCYRRMYGGHSSWMPPPYMKPGRRVADFRAALAASISRPPPKPQVLFQLRHNRVRMMVNEPEVVRHVLADASVGRYVNFVVMEELSVVEQFRIVSSSRALAGMHGMGLAWAMLLASEAGGKSSCLEITGTWSKFNRLDYFSMSRANGVQYMRLSQPNAIECIHCRRCSYRTCGNITANASEIVSKLRVMVNWWGV